MCNLTEWVFRKKYKYVPAYKSNQENFVMLQTKYRLFLSIDIVNSRILAR